MREVHLPRKADVVTGASLALVIGAVELASCEGVRIPDAPRLTSSPSPAATGTTTRTVDRTGWVDNAGRTSEEWGRSETSGMRATELGAERVTGTPGVGVPLPIDGPEPSPRIGEGAGALDVDDPTAADISGAPADVVGGRLARALCDHEVVCGHVGAGQRWLSDGACMEGVRARTRAQLDEMACPNGIDRTQLAVCLVSIRKVSCATTTTEFDTVDPCRRSALCAPP